MLQWDFLPKTPVIGLIYMVVLFCFGSVVALTAGREKTEVNAQNAEKWYNRSMIIFIVSSPLIVLEGVVISYLTLRCLVVGLSMISIMAFVYASVRSIACNLDLGNQKNDQVSETPKR